MLGFSRNYRAALDEWRGWRRDQKLKTANFHKAEAEARGYIIRAKYVAIAYAGELMIIVASLYGQWLLSRKYGHGEGDALALMMMAPVVYAVIELCRVPLAIAARTQRSIIVKLLACVGIVFAAGVTTKSLSQLGEQMFHPRMMDVVRANEAMKVTEREQATFDKRIQAADAIVEQRQAELKGIEDRSANLTKELGTVAKPQCTTLTGRNGKTGSRWSSQKCTPDPKGAIIQANLETAAQDRAAASTLLDTARADLAKLDRDAIDRRVSEAKTAYRDAVLNSQLHSFTAMFFAKDPGEVSDAEVHEFLRLFVFVPALLAAFASTLLATAAVVTVNPKDDPETLALPAGAAHYALTPMVQHMIAETTKNVLDAGHAEVKAAAASAPIIPMPTPKVA